MIIKAIGAGAFLPAIYSFSGVGAAAEQQQRPTVTATSPECETLQLSRSTIGPMTTVGVDGPESLTTSLARGESETVDVEPGTYTVDAWVDDIEESGPAIVEPSEAIEVDECLPPGIDTWVDCSRDRDRERED